MPKMNELNAYKNIIILGIVLFIISWAIFFVATIDTILFKVFAPMALFFGIFLIITGIVMRIRRRK